MVESTRWSEERVEALVSRRSQILGPSVWAAAQPDARPVISFGGGLPDIPTLPSEILLRATATVLDRDRKQSLQYGGTFGPWELRQRIAERSTGLEGIDVAPEQVIITSGSAHAIGVACETLVDFGDVVLVESPTFPGSLRTMRSFGADVVPVPMDADGLRVDLVGDELRRLADEGRRVKLIYTIPTHQNPEGTTLPLERREQLVALARDFDAIILEDDAYGELWFGDPPPPSLFALSGGEDVLKVSSFSKIVATGLRMGWTMGPAPLISRMAALRYDMGSSPYLGYVLAELIQNGDLDLHVDQLRRTYRRKLERTTAAIDRYCADYCSYQAPGGGFFLWLALRADLPCAEVVRVAYEKGVVVSAGPNFFVGESGSNHLRLSFSYVDAEDIEAGIETLGEAMAEVAASGAGAG